MAKTRRRYGRKMGSKKKRQLGGWATPMTEEEIAYLAAHPIDLVGDLSGTISDQASADAVSSANASSTLYGGKRRKRKSRRQHNKRKAKTLMSEHKKLVESSKPLNYKNYGEGRQRGGGSLYYKRLA